MMVYKLTESQAMELTETELEKSHFYNPIQDKDGNWIITDVEVDLSSLEWLKSLPKIQYNPKPVTIAGLSL